MKGALADALARARSTVTDDRTWRERNVDLFLLGGSVAAGVVPAEGDRPVSALALSFVDPKAAEALAKQEAAARRVADAESELRNARYAADDAARRLARERDFAGRLAMLRELRAIVLDAEQQTVLDFALADLDTYYTILREEECECGDVDDDE